MDRTSTVETPSERPSNDTLEGAFVAWLQEIVDRMDPDVSVSLGETMDEACQTMEQVKRWPERWHREGVGEGMRQTLVVAAEGRFGASTASRLADLLAPIDDVDRLGDLACRVAVCGNRDELIEEVSERQA
ncbi:MAG: hypothetical protein F4Y01_11355 [Gammaproteobacteria bacterium]|nr:hypothetical protein [Gammaproteobacteria bacterium]